MKKLFVIMTLLISMSFCVTSCNKVKNVTTNDSTLVDTVAVDSIDNLVDTLSADTVG